MTLPAARSESAESLSITRRGVNAPTWLPIIMAETTKAIVARNVESSARADRSEAHFFKQAARGFGHRSALLGCKRRLRLLVAVLLSNEAGDGFG